MQSEAVPLDSLVILRQHRETTTSNPSCATKDKDTTIKKIGSRRGVAKTVTRRTSNVSAPCDKKVDALRSSVRKKQ